MFRFTSILYLAGIGVGVAGLGANHLRGMLEPARTQVETEKAAQPEAKKLPAQRVQPGPVEYTKPAKEEPRVFDAWLGKQDSVTGRVRVLNPFVNELKAATNLTLKVVRNRKVIAAAEPGAGGRYEFSGLHPGAYSVVGTGTDGIIAFGLRVFRKKDATPGSNDLDFDVLAVPSSNAPTATAIVRKHFANRFAPGTRFGSVPRAIEVKPFQPKNTANLTYKTGPVVTLTEKGELIGRFLQLDETGTAEPLGNAEISILREGKVIGQGVTSTEGIVAFSGFSRPAHISIVCTHNRGVLLLSVDLVASKPVSLLESNLAHVAILQPGGVVNFEGAVVDPNALQFITDEFPPEEEDEEPPAPAAPFSTPQIGGGAAGGSDLIDALLAAGLGFAAGLLVNTSPAFP